MSYVHCIWFGPHPDRVSAVEPGPLNSATASRSRTSVATASAVDEFGTSSTACTPSRSSHARATPAPISGRSPISAAISVAGTSGIASIAIRAASTDPVPAPSAAGPDSVVSTPSRNGGAARAMAGTARAASTIRRLIMHASMPFAQTALDRGQETAPMLTTSPEFKQNAKKALADAGLQKALKFSKPQFMARRTAAVANLPEFEQLRDIGRDIKNHTLANLDFYLETFAANVEANGGHVHWCSTADDARATVLDICRKAGARTVTKGKSMISEELGINAHLSAARHHPRRDRPRRIHHPAPRRDPKPHHRPRLPPEPRGLGGAVPHLPHRPARPTASSTNAATSSPRPAPGSATSSSPPTSASPAPTSSSPKPAAASSSPTRATATSPRPSRASTSPWPASRNASPPWRTPPACCASSPAPPPARIFRSTPPSAPAPAAPRTSTAPRNTTSSSSTTAAPP